MFSECTAWPPNEVFGAWREGQHEDLVLAVAIAAALKRNYCLRLAQSSRRIPNIS